MDNQSLIDHAKQVLELEIAGLQKVRDALGVSFEQAVGTIEASLAAGGRVVVTGPLHFIEGNQFTARSECAGRGNGQCVVP